MNFERKIDPKASMGIGRRANATHIQTILEERPIPQTNMAPYRLLYGKCQLSRERIHGFLRELNSHKKLDKRFVRNKFPTAPPPNKYQYSWASLEGQYVVYDNELYLIPEFFDGGLMELSIKQVS